MPFFVTSSPSCFFFFNAPAPTEIYTLSLHDALPISGERRAQVALRALDTLWFNTGTLCNLTCQQDRKSTRLNSSHSSISYAVFCLKKKKKSLPSCTAPARLEVSSCSTIYHSPPLCV